jgi:hypothetical protein
MDKGKQWEQLPMFMSANEILNTHTLGDQDVEHHESREDVLTRKLDEAYEDDHGLYDGDLASDIRKNGVEKPLDLYREADGENILHDGHHRLAVQYDWNPDDVSIPVTHRDATVNGGQSHGFNVMKGYPWVTDTPGDSEPKDENK